MTIHADDLAANDANWMPLDPASFLERAATAHPEHIAVIHGDRHFTYADFYRRCRRLASALQRAGVEPGDVVSLMATNTPQDRLPLIGDPRALDLDDALTLEAHHQQRLARAGDFAERAAAFIDKRQPNFSDR